MNKMKLNLKNVFAIVICLTASVIVLSSCSSPERDGIRAARRMHQCDDDFSRRYIEIARERDRAHKLFISRFSSYAFESRVDAREKLNEYLASSQQSLERLQERYRECSRRASEHRDRLRNRYRTNEERARQFDYAFNNYQPRRRENRSSRRNASQENRVNYHSKVRELIQSIIPPAPNAERLKNDLVGRTINNQTSGFGFPNWRINSADELNGLEIINITPSGTTLTINARVSLQRNNLWDADISVVYVLPNYEDWWRLQTFTGQMNIVRTYGYNDCITTSVHRNSNLAITNSCDVGLVVAGTVTRAGLFGPISDDFVVQIDGNSEIASVGRFSMRINSYVIHFIERAGL